jgi:hypothetical protein
MIVPKLFSFSLEMNIIHEFTPGWTGKANNKKFEKESYPYSVQYKKDRKPDKQTSEGVNNKAIDPNSVKAIDPNSVIAINANSVLPYIPEKTENIAINQASKTLKQVKK